MPQIAGFRGQLPDAERDTSRALYRYHQVYDFGGRQEVRKTLFAAIKLVAWTEGNVRPHEATIEADRDAELARIRATKTHTTPVFCGYKDAATEVDRQFKKLENADKPSYETESAGVKHRVWRVQSSEVIGDLRKLFAPKKLHLLEGHARYQAMVANADELDAKQPLAMYSSGKFAMFCLVNVDDPALISAPHHRVVRGLSAKSAEVLAQAKRAFIIEKVSRDPAKLGAALADTVAHQPAFAIAFAGEPDAYKLTLSPEISLLNEGVSVNRALQKLDPIVTESFFAARFLPGAKLTGERDLTAAFAAEADAVIATRPVPLDQILHAGELGQLMPEKATAFVPQLASLVTFSIDPDEDLV
jgi:uncharacterized protein (DUF1015 family)